MVQTILLFGGISGERLVSVASAQNMAKALFSGERTTEAWFIASEGAVHRVEPQELERHENPFQRPFLPTQAAFAPTISEALNKISGASLFLALHGTEGEDGSLQELFERKQIAFTGSGSQSSKMCFDKLEGKRAAQAAGLRVASQISFEGGSLAAAHEKLASFFAQHGRLVMKPIANGSSIGLRMISTLAEVREAAEAASRDKLGRFMAEPFLSGREVTIGVIDQGGHREPRLLALPVSEVAVEAGRSFDYEGKYLGAGSIETTPADLPDDVAKACQDAAVKAHRALGCFGYSRTDMILAASGPVFLETNTLPGLSKASFIPQQLKAAGVTLGDFAATQLELAQKRRSHFFNQK